MNAPLCRLAVLVLASCTPDPEPRRAPFPTFDPQGPFPAPATAPEGSISGAGGSGARGSGARSLDRALSQVREGAADAPPDTVHRQRVLLSDTLQSTLPVDYSAWRLAGDGRLTLVVHTTEEGGADALILTESFQPLVQRAPSLELRRFQLTVDPALVQSHALPRLVFTEPAWSALPLPSEIPLAEAVEALFTATTRTLGRGIGYRSTPGSFTGWRWVGRNDHDLELRLGRTRGIWGTQDPVDAGLAATLTVLETEMETLDLASGRLQAGTATGTWRGRAASLVLGSAVSGPSSGVHLAMLCLEAPTCPVAEEMARFLADLEPTTRTASAGGGDSLQSLAAEFDLGLRSDAETLDPDRIPDLLEAWITRPEDPPQAADTGGTPVAP